MFSITSSSGWSFPQSSPEHTWIDVLDTPKAQSNFCRQLPITVQTQLHNNLPSYNPTATSTSSVPNTSNQWRERLHSIPQDILNQRLNESVEGIVRSGSMIQSRKGLLTAGVSKSVSYALRKIGKRFRG